MKTNEKRPENQREKTVVTVVKDVVGCQNEGQRDEVRAYGHMYTEGGVLNVPEDGATAMREVVDCQ